MATESFLATALPNSADPASPMHVSVFISHRLTPDGAEGVVNDFPNIVDWPTTVSAARIVLTGFTAGGGVVDIPVTADFSTLDSGLWSAMFPGSYPVRPWNTPDLTATPWRTFPAHRMQQHSLLVHAAGVFSSPVDPPTVRGNALTVGVMNAIGLGQWARRLRVEDVIDPELDLDGRATTFLDDVSGGGFVGAGSPSVEAQPFGLMALDAHRARRYYQRAEEAKEYFDHPQPGAEAVPLSRPTPDFHERASSVGDLSALLRTLGLVVDLHIDDLAALAGVVAIQADLLVDGLDNAVGSQPRVACAVSGTALYATSSTGDYLGGLLRIGDEERFGVLDLDPDAQALKLEQYLRNTPRMLATESNGDRVTSAPHALRSTGFSIARVDRGERLRERLDNAPARAADLLAGTAPPLHIEDVTRGLRLEVWDDVSRQWHSLHQRRIDVDVDGVGKVLVDEPDTGFLQGASLTRADGPDGGVAGAPYHAHEVLAGWEGWSLAAPRPGRVIVHRDGDEKVLEHPPEDPAPIHPVRTTSRVQPGSLPWLRLGRNYAFRSWAVDLAGNSSPHAVTGAPPVAPAAGASAVPAIGRRGRAGSTTEPKDDDPRWVRTAAEVAAERLGGVHRDALVTFRRAQSQPSVDQLRTELRALRPPIRSGPQPGRGAQGLDFSDVSVTGVTEVDTWLQRRLALRRERTGRLAARRAAVEEAFTTGLETTGPLMERIDARLDPSPFADALVAAARTGRATLDSGDLSIAEILIALSGVVTTPRPFLRWSPVVEPVVVPRRPYTEAESQLTLVIRSGVEQPVVGEIQLDVVAPGAYAAATIAAHPELDLQWTADSQRHLLPPKATQLECEQFGAFDDAFGPGGGAGDVKAALAASLRESGTLFDTTIADLTAPGARVAQPGVGLHTTPTAETPTVVDPADLERGEPLTRGQYVVHDVDHLVVPYLPDPFAAGLSMVFPDAGQGHTLQGLFAVESVRLDYRDDWPEPHPIRLVLETGERLHGEVDEAGHVLTVQLPPGEQLRFRLSTALDRQQLAWLGLWRSLPSALQSLDLLAEAAADGWFWWLTPATEVRLVHAVPKPVEVPRPTIMFPFRTAGDTAVAVVGAVDVHAPSTERLDLEASWSEWIDDIAKPAPAEVDVVAAAAQLSVGADDDLVVTGADDLTVPLPDGTSLRVRKMVHQLGDTRHRMIDYRDRATTRYREYFDPRVLPTADDVSVIGPTRTLNVPSTARPPKPVVHDVLPVFRWYTDTEPDQPFGLRRTRRSGLRIYLDRPWYASGNGELLGVLLALGSDVPVSGHVSQWGADPVYLQQGPAFRGALPLVDFAHLVGLDDRHEPARPVGPLRTTRLVDVAGRPQVGVLGYQPEYDAERQMWFADVAIDPGSAFWPFIRLAVARLQVNSLPDMDLSAVIHCDFVPLPPQRTATVSRPDEQHARVVVTGPVGVPGGLGGSTFLQMVAASRTMRARVERRVPGVDTDLGWELVSSVDLPVLGLDGTTVSWAGVLELPSALAPARPGDDGALRVTLEEWERLPADPATPRGPVTVQARIVYADHITLP
jgi:hypothetical protein